MVGVGTVQGKSFTLEIIRGPEADRKSGEDDYYCQKLSEIITVNSACSI